MKERKTPEEAEIILQNIINSFNKGKIYKGLNSICNIKKFQEVLKIKTSFLNDKLSYVPITIQRLWHIVNNIFEVPICTECKKEVKFVSLIRGYSKTCSYKCGANPIRNEKSKQTNLIKYGVENPSQNNEIHKKKKQTKLKNFGDENYNNREKAKETCVEKYGVENAFQNKEIKENTKTYNVEKYGVEFFSQTEEYKEKIKNTNLERYGVEHSLQSLEIREKGKKTKLKLYDDENYTNYKKNKETCLKKYGVENPLLNEDVKLKISNTVMNKYGVGNVFQNEDVKNKIKQTNIKKYGVEYPNQNSDMFEKNKKTRFKRKEYIMPSGKILKIQGYENHTLNLLLKTHNENDLIVSDKEIENIIGKIWYVGKDNKEHRYFPDLYCVSENRIYETKSDYTFLLDLDENNLKMEATKSFGLDFVFYIFNSKHKLLNEQELIQKRKPE